jgi:hypothetical protein
LNSFKLFQSVKKLIHFYILLCNLSPRWRKRPACAVQQTPLRKVSDFAKLKKVKIKPPLAQASRLCCSTNPAAQSL